MELTTLSSAPFEPVLCIRQYFVPSIFNSTICLLTAIQCSYLCICILTKFISVLHFILGLARLLLSLLAVVGAVHRPQPLHCDNATKEAESAYQPVCVYVCVCVCVLSLLVSHKSFLSYPYTRRQQTFNSEVLNLTSVSLG